MRRAPRDSAFNRVVQTEVMNAAPNERVIFIDTDNQVREVVYPSEFDSDALTSTRSRLEREGVLKAVVHVSATVFGTPAGTGPRTSVVEYLPDGQYYAIQWQARPVFWAEMVPEDVAKTQQLFNRKEDDPDP